MIRLEQKRLLLSEIRSVYQVKFKDDVWMYRILFYVNLFNNVYRVGQNSNWYKQDQRGQYTVENEAKIRNNKITLEASFSRKIHLKINLVRVQSIDDWRYTMNFAADSYLLSMFLYTIHCVTVNSYRAKDMVMIVYNFCVGSLWWKHICCTLYTMRRVASRIFNYLYDLVIVEHIIPQICRNVDQIFHF